MAEELPLFVLPMILLPGEVQHLRIFEPRYKQMLDDCLLDEKNFGLVLNDDFSKVDHSATEKPKATQQDVEEFMRKRQASMVQPDMNGNIPSIPQEPS